MHLTDLKIIEPDTSVSNIFIGNSCFMDDTWDLRPFIKKESFRDNYKEIRFGYIKNEDMRHVAKLYAYYRLGKVAPQTVRQNIDGELPNFIEFCEMNGIKSFVDVTRDDFLTFNVWLKTEKKIIIGTGFRRAWVVEDYSGSDVKTKIIKKIMYQILPV